jgi:hypothetical protein
MSLFTDLTTAYDHNPLSPLQTKIWLNDFNQNKAVKKPELIEFLKIKLGISFFTQHC